MASKQNGQTLPDDIPPISRRALLNSGAAAAVAGTVATTATISSAVAQSSGVQHSADFLRAKDLWDRYWNEVAKLGDLSGDEFIAEKERMDHVIEPWFDEYTTIRSRLILQSDVSFSRLYDLAAIQRWEFWDESGKHSEDFDAEIENAILSLVETLARGEANV